RRRRDLYSGGRYGAVYDFQVMEFQRSSADLAFRSAAFPGLLRSPAAESETNLTTADQGRGLRYANCAVLGLTRSATVLGGDSQASSSEVLSAQSGQFAFLIFLPLRPLTCVLARAPGVLVHAAWQGINTLKFGWVANPRGGEAH